MIHKILVATDFSKASSKALLAGISLALRCQAEVITLHVDTRVHLHGRDHPECISELRDRLDQCLSPEMSENVRKEIVMGSSESQEIMKYARSQGCDLIVLGSHGHSRLEHLFLGSVVQKVSRISEIPVMIVPAAFPLKHANQRFERILLPTALSPISFRALKWGAEFAGFLNAHVHYVHVVDLPALEEVHSLYLMERMKLPDRSELNVDSILRQTIKDLPSTDSVLTVTLRGDPTAEILAYVKKEDIDLVIMGTHGRKGFDRFLIGSVTAGVIAKSNVPVIAVGLQEARENES